MIIVEYIDEMWTSSGSSILPADSYDCAIARFWTAYVDGKFPSLCRILIGFQEGDKEHAFEQLVASLHLLEEAFVKCSKGKSFFGGDDIGYLDIALGSHFGWIRPTEKVTGIQLLEKEKFPHLVEWFEHYRSHHAVKEVSPTTDKLLTVVEELLPRISRLIKSGHANKFWTTNFFGVKSSVLAPMTSLAKPQPRLKSDIQLPEITLSCPGKPLSQEQTKLQ
ncbi:hypothetical protein LUZ62_038330 [Rhynchospora pubera]|uniref:glutathione transferase n=1 Tax=Rhynchospora pubera TaxID=906938 RepID=A0AAV8F1V0_9POAL|nr:hypothetical protein LUZ62_038330 [Rhynchospora pubera]